MGTFQHVLVNTLRSMYIQVYGTVTSSKSSICCKLEESRSNIEAILWQKVHEVEVEEIHSNLSPHPDSVEISSSTYENSIEKE